MTATLISPPTQEQATDPQSIALRNVDMLMHLEGKYRKDLAAYLGRVPQAVSRMMKSGSAWSFNDMYRTAEFLNVSINDLSDPELSPTKALAIINASREEEGPDDGGERRTEWSWKTSNKNGGLPVVNVDDFRLRGGAWKAPAMILAA